MTRALRRVAPLLLMLVPASLAAQTRHAVHGAVRTAAGEPVSGANVFLLSTLDGAVTRDDGTFRFETVATGADSLRVRLVGFRPLTVPLTLPTADTLALVLVPEATELATITVEAGSWTVGEEPGASLTPLEVLRTPGAAADVARALQTLPGVQGVDEGTGLFVRGGDLTETRVLVNGATLLSPFRFNVPTGNVTTTVSPLLLDRIEFLAGGFGARYGNALSGIVHLTTQGLPLRHEASATASIGTVGAAGALRLGETVGVRASANYFNLAPLVAVFGQAQPYAPAPRGLDASASAIWQAGGAGEVRLFGTTEDFRFGVGLGAEGSGGYASTGRGSLAVLSWERARGPLLLRAALGWSRATLDEAFGPVFVLASMTDGRQFTAQGEWRTTRLALRAGVELERIAGRFDGRVPQDGSAAGAPLVRWAVAPTNMRSGVFTEGAARIGSRLEVTAGVRSDGFSYTDSRAADPRVRAALALDGVTLTAAWGIYHQLPDAAVLAAATTAPVTRPMRVEQWIAGAQLGDSVRTLRVELYHKRFRDLALTGPDNLTRAGGSGTSRGADLFLRLPLPGAARFRATWSLLDAERTDPLTGAMAPAPFDVRHSLTLVADRNFGRVNVAVAWRYASGRPVRPVRSAAFDAAAGRWIPDYAALGAERLPAFSRLDASASWFRPMGRTRSLVLFLAASNLLDRTNVIRWQYTPDFARRVAVRSPFNLSVFAGASFTW